MNSLVWLHEGDSGREAEEYFPTPFLRPCHSFGSGALSWRSWPPRPAPRLINGNGFPGTPTIPTPQPGSLGRAVVQPQLQPSLRGHDSRLSHVGASPAPTHTHIPHALDPHGKSCRRILVKDQATATPPTSPNPMCPPPSETQEAGTGGLDSCRNWGIAERRPQRPVAPRANQGQTGTPGFPGGGPPRAPAQGHPARGGQGGGAEPDLPAVGGGGDRPGPSHGSACASPRGRGGAGAPGAAAQERALGKGGGAGAQAPLQAGFSVLSVC